MSNLSRRRFLEKSMGATAAALAATSITPRVLAADNEAPSSPNETLGVAVIGIRGRGGDHIKGLAGRPGCEILYLCDADLNVGKNRISQVAEKQSREPKLVQDMRRVFEDPAVDVVTIATPNHWHALSAIWALQAGKDVYVEKPVSHNVSEGRRIVQVARKNNRVCQTGTQIRSTDGTKEAMKFLHDGGIGDVYLARGLCYKRRTSIGTQPDMAEAPKGVDYNLWLGPAPERAFSKNRFHYNWHWHWDYGNGDLGNQGIHQMDVARWGLGVDGLGESVCSYGGRFGYTDDGETANTQVTMHKYGPKTLIFEVRGLETDDLRGAKVGNIFYGKDGYLVMTGYSTGAAFDPEGKLIKEFNAGGDHYGNFISAVRSRSPESLNADIEQGHLSSALCHLGNISYRLGSEVAPEEAAERLASNEEYADTFNRFRDHLADNKVSLSDHKVQFGPDLAFDSATETFTGSDEANAMLTRNYRGPFVVPGENEI